MAAAQLAAGSSALYTGGAEGTNLRRPRSYAPLLSSRNAAAGRYRRGAGSTSSPAAKPHLLTRARVTSVAGSATASATTASPPTVPRQPETRAPPSGPPRETPAAEVSEKVWRSMGTKATKAVPAVRLLTCYDDTVDAIVREMNKTAAGDRIEFSVYVMEPGRARACHRSKCSFTRLLRGFQRPSRGFQRLSKGDHLSDAVRCDDLDESYPFNRRRRRCRCHRYLCPHACRRRRRRCRPRP